MDEITEIHLSEREIGAIIDEVLPIEYTSYFHAINKKHFSRDTSVGSVFTEVKNLQELLRLAISQRGTLSGDDRNKFISMGISSDFLLPECRYLEVSTAGELGVLKITELDPETKVKIVRTKPNTPCSLVIEKDELPKTDFATIIIGKNPNKEASTKEIVFTVHPGPPVQPIFEDNWEEGSEVGVQEVMSVLGKDVYINIKLKGDHPEDMKKDQEKTIEINPEMLKKFNSLEFSIQADFNQCIDELNKKLGTKLKSRSDVFHLTILGPQEKDIIKKLTPEHISELKRILEELQEGDGFSVEGVGFLDGSDTNYSLRDVDKSKKVAFVAMHIPKLQQFRKALGLQPKYFHITLGMEVGDIAVHIVGSEPIKEGSNIMKDIKEPIPKEANHIFDYIDIPTINFTSLTGQQKNKYVGS